MSMYNLIEYSNNYSGTTGNYSGSFREYDKDGQKKSNKWY